MAWSLHKLRERQLQQRFRLIIAERTRMTRDLHDTLLQGFTGVMYQLETAFRQFQDQPDVSRKRLGRAIEQAGSALKEARQAITFMRSPVFEKSSLPLALSGIAKELAHETDASLDIRVEGDAYPLSYDTQWCLFVVAREALYNAARHAEPEKISARVTYRNNGVTLVVKDDGAGFDVGQAGNKTGHWGLRGMKERADQMGGQLNIGSRPGEGTTIELFVPRSKEPQAQRSAN